jgi:RimK-like ATP-grasp domain
MYKRFFVEIIEEICRERRLSIKSFSDNWVLEIYKDEIFLTRTFGYNFDLNTSVSQNLVSDKVVTYLTLKERDISAVPHYILYAKFSAVHLDIEDYNLYLNEKINLFTNMNFPLIIKPVNGTSGHNVYLIKNQLELRSRAIEMCTLGNIAVCPYIDSRYEYRFYIFKNEILLVYRKVKGEDFRHNLSLGSAAQRIDHNYDKYKELKNLSLSAFAVTGLSFGAVDILYGHDNPMILEINSGLAMDNFVKSIKGNENRSIAKTIHERLLIESIKLTFPHINVV